MKRACWFAALLTACATHVGSIDIGLELDNPERVIASLHADEPTPERPKVGCIQPTMDQQAHVEGKILPEIVRVIGFTSDEDGHRAKVLRAGQFDVTKWQPWPAKAIAYVGCGPEAEAYGAAASAPPRSQRRFPDKELRP